MQPTLRPILARSNPFCDFLRVIAALLHIVSDSVAPSDVVHPPLNTLVWLWPPRVLNRWQVKLGFGPRPRGRLRSLNRPYQILRPLLCVSRRILQALPPLLERVQDGGQ